MTHDDLVQRAEKWLSNQGCGVVIKDPFRAHTVTGETPDAIGWRDGLSLMVECKASRSDFLADKKKRFRIESSKGMGDWRFYMCEPEVIKVDDLPFGWGLLYCTGKSVKKIHGIPTNCNWWSQKPFEGYKRSETQILYSALRRMVARGHFKEIYEGITTRQAK